MNKPLETKAMEAEACVRSTSNIYLANIGTNPVVPIRTNNAALLDFKFSSLIICLIANTIIYRFFK